jgi:hypothetical protein
LRWDRQHRALTKYLSEADWTAHHAWIEEHARTSLLEALRDRADRGAFERRT